MLKQIAFMALLGMSASAMAGDWQVKIGASAIAPTNDTTVDQGVVAKADHEYAFTPSIEYFFAESPFSAELLLATPIKHDVLVNGVKQAQITQLPPTLTAKYHFKNSTRFTPYIGLGATAFISWDEEGLVKDVKEELGVAGQIGFNFQPADAKNWGVFFDARYAQLSPEVTLTTGKKFDLDIDPMIYTIGYSYKF